MVKSYCVKQKKNTLSIPNSVKYVTSKNGRLMQKSICSECGAKKSQFVGQKSGGALARYKGPSDVDKAAYIASMFLSGPAPGFGTAAKMLAGQAFKGVKDNVDHYKRGSGVDIHKAIMKIGPKNKTLPGHKYTGPGNPIHKQVKLDSDGNILEIYEKPTGSTDRISMQHDVDYTICKDDLKCKHKADKKMVKALDAIPYKERQWGHALARNMINVKQKLGTGMK